MASLLRHGGRSPSTITGSVVNQRHTEAPSTSMLSPLTNEAASEHSHTAASAISSGSPSLAGRSGGPQHLLETRVSGEERAQHGCVGQTWADRVDTNVMDGVLARRALDQAEDAMLRRRVMRLPRRCHNTGTRRGINDCAPAGAEHMRDLVLHAQEDGGEIDGDHLVPLVKCQGMELFRRRGDARIVEGAMQAAEVRYCLVHHRRDRGLRREIRLDEQRGPTSATNLLCRGHAGSRIDVGERHRRAAPRKQQGGSPSDASAAARHQCNL